MAPVRSAVTDKENAGPPCSTASRGNSRPRDVSPEKPAVSRLGSATKIAAPGPSSQSTRLRPASARTGRPVSAGPRQGAPSPATARRTVEKAAPAPAPDPWAEVEAAKAEADALQAELEFLVAEVETARAEAVAGEEEVKAAEQELTAQTAVMLADFSTKHSVVAALELELADAKKVLAEHHAENLELSRRNLELDREDRRCREELEEAETLLAQCAGSQGGLDAELAQQRAACAEFRGTADAQGARFAEEVRKLEAMRGRLAEVQKTAPLETELLLKEADEAIRSAREAQHECERIARDGIEPPCPEHLDSDEVVEGTGAPGSPKCSGGSPEMQPAN